MVLSGVAEIHIEGESHTLREGDSIHFRAHRVHAYSNPAAEPAVLLVANYPRLAL
jgi:quercetin dioxygenase-like cupin family protein